MRPPKLSRHTGPSRRNSPRSESAPAAPVPAAPSPAARSPAIRSSPGPDGPVPGALPAELARHGYLAGDELEPYHVIELLTSAATDAEDRFAFEEA
ncbi:hypothetical protein G5C65_35010, partial [Streptomyces sp. SB3404]